MLLPRRQANYDSIIAVVDRLKKMLRIEPVQMIDAPGLAKVFIDLIVRHHGLNSIVSD